MIETLTSELPEEAAVRFGRTDTMTHAVHLVECPHLVQRSWHDATEADLATLPVCQWSRDQLEGHGRSHPGTLEDAMREQGTPTGAVGLIKEHLSGVAHDEIWVPYSRSYVALGLGGRAVAAFGKSYVQIGDVRIELPGYVAGRHQGHNAQPTYGDACEVHFIARSLTGECDQCAA